jgi:formylglycine-generating enzyme required for sulfatase activity
MRNPLLQKISPYRVFRGGFWEDGSGDIRSARRSLRSPSRRYYFIGFRLFRTKEKS